MIRTIIIAIILLVANYFLVLDTKLNMTFNFFIIIITIIYIYSKVVENKETELKNKEEIIHELYSLTDNVSDSICLINEDGNIVYANKEFKKKICNECIGKDIKGIIPDIDKNIFGFKDRIYQKEVYTNRKGVKKLFFLDISKQYMLEKMRQEFSANVSHEIKTPLTTIMGYAELLSIGMFEKEKVKEIGSKIYNQSNELLEMLDEIIKISKLEEGNLEVDKESINLLDLFEDELDMLKTRIEKKNLQVVFKRKYDCIIEANKIMIKELIHNLMSNAIKYNDERKLIYIDIGPKYFSIENTCYEIKDEDLTRIFERFYRASNATNNNISGSGLGLAIVKHLAVINNWDIQVVKTTLGIKFTVLFKVEA